MRILIAIFSAVFSYAPLSAEHHHNHHSHAHEHGFAELNLVMAKNEIFVEVMAPGHTVFGFEHKARNDAQTQQMQTQIEAIREGLLMSPNAEAQCTFKLTAIENPFEGHDHHHGHHHDHHHDHDSHKNVTFEYHYQCQKMEQLKVLDTAPLFKQWPNLEKIRVQKIIHQQQSATELTASQAKLALK